MAVTYYSLALLINPTVASNHGFPPQNEVIVNGWTTALRCIAYLYIAWTLLSVVKLSYRIFRGAITTIGAYIWAYIWSSIGVGVQCQGIFQNGMEDESNSSVAGIYGLEHAALNWTWENGLRTMWMNMGYWKDTNSFPDACEGLLRYLLLYAGIIPSGTNAGRRIAIDILDLGFGCGDQTLYLTQKLPVNVTVNSYVGITLSESQFAFAKKRILKGLKVTDIILGGPGLSADFKDADKKDAVERLPFPLAKPKVSLFNADASAPHSWPSAIHLALLPPISPPASPFSTSITYETKTFVGGIPQERTSGKMIHEHWTIGLDSVYHFRPSRVAVLKYAHDKLNSSFLAFDLFRPIPATSVAQNAFQSIFLRIFCLFASVPYQNLLTEEEYVKMLVEEVGYRREDISIEDISDFVFPGLSEFIGQRTKEMDRIGMNWKWWVGFRTIGWVLRKGYFSGKAVVAKWKYMEE